MCILNITYCSSVQPQMFTPKLIYEQQVEKDAVKINCALVLNSDHVLLGAEDGLMILGSGEEHPVRLGERKVTYLERCDNMIVYMGTVIVVILYRQLKCLLFKHQGNNFN